MKTKETVRLQKYMADCGLMSRRAAEQEIAAGRVTINGVRAEIGQSVLPGEDEVIFRGKKVLPASTGPRTVTIMLNKPRGYVTTMSDEKGRPCVADLVADLDRRVFPIGRLDYDSEGLLLMTSDGELAQLLTHPRHHVPKRYHVKLKGAIEPDTLEALQKPMVLDGYALKPVKAEIVTRKPDTTVLAMTLYEGRNRQIRKMCEALSLTVLALRRVAIGDLTLGNLKPGTYRPLTKAQVDALKRQAEEKNG